MPDIDGVVEVLADFTPLHSVADLKPEFGGRHHRLDPIRKRRGNESIHPHRALILVPITERQIEEPTLDRNVIIGEKVENGVGQIGTGAIVAEPRFQHALKQNPVGRAIEQHRLEIKEEGILGLMREIGEGAALLIDDVIHTG